MQEANSEQVSVLAQARAQRVRKLRTTLGYSRHKFCAKYEHHGITPSTLHSWEAVRWNGLTEKGAKKLIDIFTQEGLKITLEWLLFGVGENPLSTFTLPSNSEVNTPQLTEQEKVLQELKIFYQFNRDAIDTIITDDSLAPWLMPGDYVAGRRYFEESLPSILNTPCIIQLAPGMVLVRILKQGTLTGHYSLVALNPLTTASEPVLENVKIFSAAPILWIRKLVLSTFYE